MGKILPQKQKSIFAESETDKEYLNNLGPSNV